MRKCPGSRSLSPQPLRRAQGGRVSQPSSCSNSNGSRPGRGSARSTDSRPRSGFGDSRSSRQRPSSLDLRRSPEGTMIDHSLAPTCQTKEAVGSRGFAASRRSVQNGYQRQLFSQYVGDVVAACTWQHRNRKWCGRLSKWVHQKMAEEYTSSIRR